MLTSATQHGFATYHQIQVRSSVLNQQQRWLINSTHDSKVALPQHFNQGSIQLSKMPSGNVTPNWHALSTFTQEYPHQCWEQTISRAVSFQFNPSSNSNWANGDKTLNADLAKQSQFQSYSNMYSYFPNLQAEPFLTAYTYLAHSWLENSSTPIPVNKEKLKEVMFNIIEGMEYWHIDPQSKSMALLALAQNKDIDLQEALTIRQKLGTSDSYATALQSLALKVLGADRDLYLKELKALSTLGYQDSNQNLFNQSSHKCFAALAFDKKSNEQESLISEVIQQQQQNGHFGSTFANAICSYLLQGKAKNNIGYTPVEFTQVGNTLDYTNEYESQSKVEKNYWLKMQYQQSMENVPATSNGIHINRQAFVQRNNEWLALNSTSKITVGEIVKIELIVNSSIAREHVAITDSIAGGFEAINPEFSNQLYSQDLSYEWFQSNRIEIKQGQAKWYLRHLSKGPQKFTYYNRTRHTGNYNIAPAKVETMYRSDIFATTSATKVKIVERN